MGNSWNVTASLTARTSRKSRAGEFFLLSHAAECFFFSLASINLTDFTSCRARQFPGRCARRFPPREGDKMGAQSIDAAKFNSITVPFYKFS